MSITIPPPNYEIRIGMFGKTGVGKSRGGNKLIQFKISVTSIVVGYAELRKASLTIDHSGFLSQTKGHDNRTPNQVIDAVGYFDSPQTINETLLFSPGPHVFLYVITMDGRITEECKCSFNLFRERFGKNITKHTILVLNRKPQDRNSTFTIQESEHLIEIIKECHDRYVILDNFETPSYEKCDGKLLKMILDTVRSNGGSHYTREMYSKAVEQYNAKLKLEEDNRKLTLTGLLNKQELKKKLTGLVERGRLPDAPYSKIRANYIALQEHIVNPRDICRELFSAFVFDKEDKRIIESEKDRIEQTDKLLMTLVERGQKAFGELLQALCVTGHHQAKQILEQDSYEDVSAAEDNRYLGMKITFPDLHYQSEYRDPNNNKYKDLKDELETFFGEYGCDATVISLSPEPVTVCFVFVTSSKTDEDSVLEILRKALKSGYLGHYRVSTDHFLFCRIGAWLTNRKTDNTEEVTPVIGDESLTEQQGGDVIVECVLTTSKSDLNNLHPIIRTVVKSGSIGPYNISTDQFSIRQIGGRFNVKTEAAKYDEQRAGASSVMLKEHATLPDKMKIDRPQFQYKNSSKNIRKPDAKPITHSISRADISRTLDVTPQTEPVMPGTDNTEEEYCNELSVFVGKAGRGKSGLLQHKGFLESSVASESVTCQCRAGFRDIQAGKRLVVVDTPGLFDTGIPLTLISKFFSFMSVCRIRHEELDTVEHQQKWFGKEVMHHVICVLGYVNSLATKWTTIKEYVKQSPPQLRSLIDRCNGRMATINNRAPPGSIEGDVDIILHLVKQTLLCNGGKHYKDARSVEAGKVYQSVKELGEKFTKHSRLNTMIYSTNVC